MAQDFSSEKDLQESLESALEEMEGLADLVVNLDYLETFQSENMFEARIHDSFKSCERALYYSEIISRDKNISIQKGEILKPDLLLYASEAESIVIVELKNRAKATREAGTELGAYSSEVKSIIPFISDGDIIHVLISTEWPVLLRHYVTHEIVWGGKNLICMHPSLNKGDLELNILGIDDLAENLLGIRIPAEYLGGYQICLYDDELYTEKADRTRLDAHIEQMLSALHSMEVAGNRVRSHGFAFLWKDLWEQSVAPYSITVMNFAPFQTLERYLHLDSTEYPEIVKRFMQIARDYDPEGHGIALSTVTDACADFANSFCSPHVEGFAHWPAHKDIMAPRAEYIAFVGWGLFGEEHARMLKEAYESGDLDRQRNCPHLGLEVINQVIDDEYEYIPMGYFFHEEADE